MLKYGTHVIPILDARLKCMKLKTAIHTADLFETIGRGYNNFQHCKYRVQLYCSVAFINQLVLCLHRSIHNCACDESS